MVPARLRPTLLCILAFGCGSNSLVTPVDDGGLDGGLDAGFPARPPSVIGSDRTAQLIVPTTYSNEVLHPVVFLFHAYKTPPENADAVWEVSQAAEEIGFLLVLPRGELDDGGSLYWASGPIDQLSVTTPADDLGYIRHLYEELRTVARVDPQRVIAMGASNGGNMSLHLVCQASDVFTGAMSVIGTSYPTANMCPPAVGTPSRVVMVKGTADAHYLYEGGEQEGVSYPGALEMAHRFAARNGCNPDVTTELPALDVDFFVEGIDTEGLQYDSGCTGSEVRLYSTIGGGHASGQLPPFVWDMIRWLFREP